MADCKESIGFKSEVQFLRSLVGYEAQTMPCPEAEKGRIITGAAISITSGASPVSVQGCCEKRIATENWSIDLLD